MKFPGSSEPRAGREPSPENGGFELVELTANDWQELKNLRLQALKDTPRAYGRTFQEESSLDEQEWRDKFSTGRYFCAREGGRLVGMLCMVRERGEKVSHIMNVYSVYVAPEARRRGVATALLERVLTEAADGNTHKIRLRVDAQSEGAKALYESMGFTEVGYLQDEIKEGDEYVDELIMEKFLG